MASITAGVSNSQMPSFLLVPKCSWPQQQRTADRIPGIYQLLTAIPQLRHFIEDVVATDPYIFTRSLATQMEYFIIHPLKKAFENNRKGRVDSEGPKVIILDGLDECATQEAQRSILRDSVRKFPIVPICFLIASRPEKAIRDSFNDQPLLAITARLVLDDRYHPDDDIRPFLAESFESVKRTHELRSLLPRAWPTIHEIEQLVRKPSGQFIYAATVVKFVGSSRGRPKEQLDIILGITTAADAAPFAELDALYCRIFSFVLKDHLPRALEILSVAFLVETHGEHLTARRIETILSGNRKKPWHSRAYRAITVQGLPCTSEPDLYHQNFSILGTTYLVSSVYHG